MARKPKHPIDRAYVSDDGSTMAVVIGLSEGPGPDGLTRFAKLILKSGTTQEEAMGLAKTINERLVSVALVRL